MGCGGSTSRVVSPELKVTEEERNGHVYGNGSKSKLSKPDDISPEEIQNSGTAVLLDEPSEANKNASNNNTTQNAAATKIQAQFRGYIVRKTAQSESDSVFLRDDTAPMQEKAPSLIVTNAIENAVNKVTVEDEQQENKPSSVDPQRKEEETDGLGGDSSGILWTSPEFATPTEKKEQGSKETEPSKDQETIKDEKKDPHDALSSKSQPHCGGGVCLLSQGGSQSEAAPQPSSNSENPAKELEQPESAATEQEPEQESKDSELTSETAKDRSQALTEEVQAGDKPDPSKEQETQLSEETTKPEENKEQASEHTVAEEQQAPESTVTKEEQTLEPGDSEEQQELQNTVTEDNQNPEKTDTEEGTMEEQKTSTSGDMIKSESPKQELKEDTIESEPVVEQEAVEF